MAFIYKRMIRFQDTDAAGVVYFANIFNICHEAYEASLAESGINLKSFFSNELETALPIVHASADFRRPMFCGDLVIVELQPQPLSNSEFQINYQVLAPQPDQTVYAKAISKHVCINPIQRQRKDLPLYMQDWLERTSALN